MNPTMMAGIEESSMYSQFLINIDVGVRVLVLSTEKTLMVDFMCQLPRPQSAQMFD